MQEKKQKFKLRKWVVISIPVALIIAVCAMAIILSNNKAFVTESQQPEVKQENVLIEEESNEPGILSQNRFVQGLSGNIEKRKLDYTIVFYANKFKLNINKVLEIAHTLTNNFEDEQYKKTFIIAPAKIRNNFGPYKSAEAGIIEFVREIYRYPENFGSSLDEIRDSEEITTTRRYKDKHILLDNGFEKVRKNFFLKDTKTAAV